VNPREREVALEAERQRVLGESQRSGNLELDSEADWVDLAIAGVDGPDALSARLVEVLRAVDLEEDVFQLGLRGAINPKQHPAIAERILTARKALIQRLGEASGDAAMRSLIESFHPERYNTNATLAENLLFGTPIQPAFEVDRLAVNYAVLKVLDQVGLTEILVKAGREIAAEMVEIFADLPPDHEFFTQFSFISSDDLPEFQAILARAAREGTQMLPDDRAKLMTLPFKIIQTRHRLDVLTEDLKAKVVEARKALHDSDDPAVKVGVEFFDPDSYNAAATIQDNILFGKLAYGQAKASQRVGKLIEAIVSETNLRPTIVELGLEFQVGIAGARLAAPQRTKVAIARCLIKKPDLLIINEATAILDAQGQARTLEGVLKEGEGRTLVWVLHNPAVADRFDRVLVVGEGRILESGPAGELQKSGGVFAELTAAAA
jgi:energy-coupling factor transporter ATP-binding protein EcfA2